MNAEKRKRLLAKIHIAKDELLGGDDEVYRFWIKEVSGGKYRSAAKLSEVQLESLIRRFKRYGWRDKTNLQVQALRKEVAERAERKLGKNYKKRLNGLVKHIAKVERLEWVKNKRHLEQILAILGGLSDADE